MPQREDLVMACVRLANLTGWSLASLHAMTVDDLAEWLNAAVKNHQLMNTPPE